MMRTALTAFVMAGLLAAAELPNAALAQWIESQGGTAVRDGAGNIVEVSLARTWATDNDVQRLADLKELRRLDLSLTYVSDSGIESLQKLAKLEDLNLFAAEFITDAAVASLRSNKALRRLNLRGTDITDTSMQYIGELTRLQVLDVNQTQVSDPGIEHLAPLAELEELNLGGNKISGVSLNVLKLLPRLRKLSFSGIQRRNAGLCWAPVITDREMDTLALLTNLEELDIGWHVGLGAINPSFKGRTPSGEGECRIVGGTRVTDAGVAKLTALKNLKRLDLSGSPVTPTGLKRIEGLQRLERLSLWNCAALDDTIAPTIAGLPNLTSLDLSYTGVGDPGLKQFAGMARLKDLYLTDTKVTADAAEAWRKSRPGARVFWAVRPAARPVVTPANASKKVDDME